MNGKIKVKLVRVGAARRLTRGGMGVYLEAGALFQMTPS